MMQSEANSTNYNMKLFTACAMVLVVAGHVSGGSIGLAGPLDLFNPYSYHVAAFVFVSGYFYREASEADVAAYVARKAKRLMLPLYAISLAYGCLWTLARHVIGVGYGGDISLYSVLVAPLTSGHQYMVNCPMWFIAPLFFAQCANVAIRKCTAALPLEGARRETALLAAYLALGSVAIAIGGKDGLGGGWLLLLCRSLFFLACFGMGRYYRAVLEERDTAGDFAYFAVLFAVQMGVVILLGGNYGYTPSWCRFPGGVLGTYAVTVTGIAFLLRFCKILGPKVGSGKCVLAVADNSFSIMCHHLAGMFLLNTLIYAVSSTFGVFNGFDFEAYASTYSYAFAPWGCAQFALAYIVAGILFSIAVHRVWACFKGRLWAALGWKR